LACKNYIFCKREWVGDYSISTANGNVEGVDMLAGAGILDLPNIYVQQTPVNVPHCSVDNYWFWCRVSSVVPKLSICRPNLYCPMLLVHVLLLSEIDLLQSYLDSALTKLENWLKASNKIYLY
jgi:hypothetical protein